MAQVSAISRNIDASLLGIAQSAVPRFIVAVARVSGELSLDPTIVL